MKDFLKITIVSLCLVFIATTNSFALVDASVWGGYVFKGELESSDEDVKGGNYGLKGHYNTSLFPMLELGVGAYYQYTNVKMDLLNDEEDITRQTFGLDANLILSLPIVHPYIRGTYSFVDKFKYLGESDTEKFKGYGFGGGLELTVAPFIRVFGEYMYDYTEHDLYLKAHAINVGLKLDI